MTRRARLACVPRDERSGQVAGIGQIFPGTHERRRIESILGAAAPRLDVKVHEVLGVQRIGGDDADGRRLLTVPSYTGNTAPAVLWDLEHYRVIARLEGNDGQVFSSRFVAVDARVPTKPVLDIDSSKPIEVTSVLGGLHLDYRRAA
jgi:hypothetical protein